MRLLRMDFQPNFMAGHSLQDHDRSHWERTVRPSVVPAQQARCSICGFVAQNRRLIHADEVWSFPWPHKAILVDVRPLCTRCHEAKDYAHLQNLIRVRARSKSRDTAIRGHYCNINKCTEDEFWEDCKAALNIKVDLENLYGANCRVEVDYRAWSRPKEKPRLRKEEQQFLRRALETLDTPISINDHKLSTYRMAVRTIQSIPLNYRAAVFDKLRSMVDEAQDDGEVITERDEGIQWE